jgi:hypothetical protein
MLSDLVRTVVQRVLRDKILLGLLIVAILGVWVGGMTMSDDKDDAKKAASGEKATEQAVQPSVQPKLAAEFVSWWLRGVMDYNAASASESHQQAVKWVTPEAGRSFVGAFWTNEIADSVLTGRMVAGFQPTAVAPIAVNKDGSIVVGVNGTMVVQAGGPPSTQPFAAAFLVRQEKDGLRVAGIDAKSGLLPGSQVF